MGDDPRSGPVESGPWRRLFTAEEANALLPELVPILTDLRAKKGELDEARRALARLTPAMRANGHAIEAVALERRIRGLAAALTAGIRRITGQGVEIKDLDRGLIDFPSPREGRVVFLCWRLGEDRIAYWHEVDAGFAGRRPL